MASNIIIGLAALVAALVGGELLFRRAAGTANWLRDAATVFWSIVYLVIGVGSILFGGKVGMIAGVLLVSLYWWLGRSAGDRFSAGSLRSRIADGF